MESGLLEFKVPRVCLATQGLTLVRICELIVELSLEVNLVNTSGVQPQLSQFDIGFLLEQELQRSLIAHRPHGGVASCSA